MTPPTKSDFFEKLTGARLPVSSYADEECPICYEQLSDPIKTDCNHFFCLECAKTWFEGCHTCSSCRTPLYETPDDYEDSDEDSEGESDEDSEDEVWQAVNSEAHWQTERRALHVLQVRDHGNLLAPYNDREWAWIEQLWCQEYELDMEDTVLREALYYLCIEVAHEDPRAIFNLQIDMHGPTFVTQGCLRSQAMAAVTALNPGIWIERDTGLIPTLEASCERDWEHVGRYVFSELAELAERRPELTGRDLYRRLCRDWEKYIEEEQYLMYAPEFHPRLDDDFQRYTDALFQAITFFAQQAAKTARADDSTPVDSELERLRSIASAQLEQAMDENYGENETQAIPTPSKISEPINTYPPLCAEAEALLQQATAAVKKRIITQSESACKSLAYALIKCEANLLPGKHMWEELNEEQGPFCHGPFCFLLCFELEGMVRTGPEEDRTVRSCAAEFV